MGAAKILLIEDDEAYVNSIRMMLRQHPIEITWAPSGAHGIQAYRKNTLGYATVIVDYLLPDLKGSEVAQHIKKINPIQDILFASGFERTDYLTDMLMSGLARTFIPKGTPVEESRNKILDSISIFENKHRVLDASDYSQSRTEQMARQFNLIGRSRAIHKVVNQILLYRDLPHWVRVVGETGVGKELVAKALVPSGKHMVAISCPEFTSSENTLESELFGHVKGSFTGADADKPGLLLQAHGQVLFLDEIHTLSMTAQEKLLRVLQEKKFRRKGDSKDHTISVDFRLISAAKPVIRDYVKNETFLEDLYYRLGSLDIYVPPLRERPEDIEPIILHVQEEYNRPLPPEKRKQFRVGTIREMEKHSWPGNVRTLISAACKMLINSRANIVEPTDFVNYLNGPEQIGSMSSLRGRSMTEATDKLESEQIISALKSSKTQQQAADKLGINRYVLIRRMGRFGIDAKKYILKHPNERNIHVD